MNFTVKRKGPDGKYFTFGNVQKNQYGNYSLGMKVTPQLKALIASINEGEWVNFNLFSADKQEPKGQAAKVEAAVNFSAPLDEEVPF